MTGAVLIRYPCMAAAGIKPACHADGEGGPSRCWAWRFPNSTTSASCGRSRARWRWAKFIDPQFSTKHAQFIREHPDVLTTGLVTEEQERRRERWVCEPCFEDFATEFGWVASAR